MSHGQEPLTLGVASSCWLLSLTPLMLSLTRDVDSCRVVIRHVMSCQVRSGQVISYHVISCHVMSRRVTVSFLLMSSWLVFSHPLYSRVMSCHVRFVASLITVVDKSRCQEPTLTTVVDKTH